MSYIPFINHPYKRFHLHPYKKYHSAFLNDYLESIKDLDLSQEFNSLNLSQVSFHILYNCEFSSWSEKLREEVQRVKQIYLTNSIFAQILHPVERRYVDRDKHYFERYFNNDDFVEISDDSLSFEEDKIYQITPKKFTRVYNNVYYDNHTNEEDYYEDKDDSDLGSDSEEYYPIDKEELNPIDHLSCCCHICSSHTDFVPFNGFAAFSVNLMAGKEISNTIEQIKQDIKFCRFKSFTVNLTEEDIRPFYYFVDINDEKLYEKLDKYKIGIYVNKDHPDPLRRKKVRDFANLYFAYDLYKFHYENMSKSSKIFQGCIFLEESDPERYYDGIYLKYSNMPLSFLNYSITKDHTICKLHPSHFFREIELSRNFDENNKLYSPDVTPYISLKLKYPYITQEEITLLDKYPMQAAFIYKNYPYLQNPLISNKNYDPFFNMLRILEKTNCKLNISKI